MKRGFSLVELSIVLVILGLLTGGILAGQSLIRAAELRAVSTEYQRYTTAFGAFRDKYFYLPGDMPNAVKFWNQQAGGTADGYDAACGGLTSAATDAKTCNGDGNGYLGTSGTGTTFYEWYRAWQHLANAGLIEGTYAGVSQGSSTFSSLIGSNVPRSKLSNAGWTVRGDIRSLSGDTNFFDGPYGNMFLFGAAVANNTTQGVILKPEEAWNIDTKLDDGKPQSGRILAYKYAFMPTCVVSTNDAYALSLTAAGCSLLLLTGY